MSCIITVAAPVNIAVIKYWGKRNEELILPLNDSISVTLDAGVMCAKTSVCASPLFTSDELWLNGKKESFSNGRLQKCLEEIKRLALIENSVPNSLISWRVHVCSENNFPTAAGLASSAAGYACLVYALAKLYKVQSDISSVARLGSGSACRSVFGGFVRWHTGIDDDGKDSVASQIEDATHWPELRILILVTGETKKKISSTKGMRISVETSDLLKYRIQHCVPKRTEEMVQAIRERDFSKFGEITMMDSNQFHAICLDSYPPINYLTDASHAIIKLVHSYNNMYKDIKVAYTFDAGSNACLYLLEKDVSEVLAVIKHVFPSSNPDKFITGLNVNSETLDLHVLEKLDLKSHEENLIKYIIYTKVGEGPTEVLDESHLLNSSGLPKNISIS